MLRTFYQFLKKVHLLGFAFSFGLRSASDDPTRRPNKPDEFEMPISPLSGQMNTSNS
jgi:hypothetical protein